jgi:prephenate dehydrogenase
MWRDIAIANHRHLGRALSDFISELRKFESTLKRGDAKAVAQFFETAKQRRDNWCACCASPSLE